MAYGGGMGYHLHMPSYFWRTFTEYPYIIDVQSNKSMKICCICAICVPISYYDTPSSYFTSTISPTYN